MKVCRRNWYSQEQRRLRDYGNKQGSHPAGYEKLWKIDHVWHGFIRPLNRACRRSHLIGSEDNGIITALDRRTLVYRNKWKRDKQGVAINHYRQKQ